MQTWFGRERNCSLPVKAVWSAACAIGPFDICELMTGVEIDKSERSVKRERERMECKDMK